MSENERSEPPADNHAGARGKQPLYRRILLVLLLIGPAIVAAFAIATMIADRGLLDPYGLIWFSDFTTYYLVGALAHTHDLAPLYNPEHYFEVSKEVLGFTESGRPLWYSPGFVLLLLPLGALPLVPALVIWSAINAASLLVWVWGSGRRQWLLLLGLLFPNATYSLAMGQNGGLTAALLGGGLLFLQRHPYIAGILIGAASIKPQLGLLFPLALAAGREWRAFFAATVTALLIALAGLIWFGMDAWIAHAAALASTSDGLEEARLPVHMLVTVFSLARQFGFDGITPTLIQTVSALAMAALVVWVWWRYQDMKLRSSILIAAGFLATPYALAHDLPLLALPLIWWLLEIGKRPRYGFEPALFALVWFLPMVNMALAIFSKIHFWPLYLLLLLAIFWWRFREPAQRVP